MKLELTLSNGNVIYPSFDVELAEGFIAYYGELLRIGFIKNIQKTN